MQPVISADTCIGCVNVLLLPVLYAWRFVTAWRLLIHQDVTFPYYWGTPALFIHGLVICQNVPTHFTHQDSPIWWQKWYSMCVLHISEIWLLMTVAAFPHLCEDLAVATQRKKVTYFILCNLMAVDWSQVLFSSSQYILAGRPNKPQACLNIVSKRTLFIRVFQKHSYCANIEKKGQKKGKKQSKNTNTGCLMSVWFFCVSFWLFDMSWSSFFSVVVLISF